MKVQLFVEGGGDEQRVDRACRRGFSKLLERAGFKGKMPGVFPCGPRTLAFDNFKTAMKSAGDHVCPILLVDGEGPVAEIGKPWQHLAKCDKWKKPKGADDDQAQLMVQCMESWIVADRNAVENFFGQGFNPSALPALHDLEGKAKKDVQKALDKATHDCGEDRKYRKGKRSFRALEHLDPETLKEHLPHFQRLCDTLKTKRS